MKAVFETVKPDIETGGLDIDGKIIHPLWLRERVTEPHMYDRNSHQRLYEHSQIPPDLKVASAHLSDQGGSLTVEFSDGYSAKYKIGALAKELGLAKDPAGIPLPKQWTSTLKFARFDWAGLDDPYSLKSMLIAYFEYAFCVIDNTPTEKDSLKTLARRFGFLRETNFGELFNVETKRDASDLAYTDAALASHTDNPYREPVPGIQFLHCLANEVPGGLSTLVDGMAVADKIGEENEAWLQILETVPARFRYKGPSGIYESTGPLISRDHTGRIARIRFSSRLDFVPALSPATLDVFYAARRRMHQLCNDPAYQIQFPFKPGTLLMMNNYRLFHGRTAYDGQHGHRHLQGCYIDQDGPQALYRSLALGGSETYLPRES